jgi:sigma-B regulation protein RsbU (phosphoserine phosphatase)
MQTNFKRKIMGDRYPFKEQLIEEIESLRREVTALKNEKAAFEVQRKLLENLVDTEGFSAETEVLKVSLQKTLDLTTELTQAEKGSLFLLEPSGKIIDAILSRLEVTPKQRAKLIGNVLDKGLAGWVIRHRQVGLIADTEKDDRWLTLSDQPYTVRSALAVPILRGEKLLGILTLLHSEPNRFSSQVAEQMQLTADQMALVLENACLYSKLDKYSKALDAELEKGRQIQIDFLPYEIYQPDNWEIAACFYPARQVSGDFYDTFLLPNNNVGLVIADVCDKGVGAALFMALMRSLIRIFSARAKLRGRTSVILAENRPIPEGWLGQSMPTNLSHLKTLQAVSLANDYVAQNHWQLSMFATMFFGVLDPATGLLSYINGGHEPLFIIGDSGIKNTLKATGPAVGMMPNVKFAIAQVQLEPGDILFGYTDGVTEGKNPEGELFTQKKLFSLLKQPATSVSQLLDRIKTNLFDYIADAPQFDDITMLAVQRVCHL